MNVTVLVCLPRYEINHAAIKMNSSGLVDLVPLEGEGQQQLNLDVWDLTSGVDYGGDYDIPDNYLSDAHHAIFNPLMSGVDTFFTLINATNPVLSLSAYLSPQKPHLYCQR